jgi:hypothetical protein
LPKIPAVRILVAQRACSSVALALFAGATFAIPAAAATPFPCVALLQRGLASPPNGPAQARGLRLNSDKALQGYTLLSPLKDTKTYLLDMRGKVAHTWESDLPPGNSVYLRPNGNLVRSARPLNNPVFGGGGEGGRIREYSWTGDVLWELHWNDKTRLQHHDFELLPNGNLLLISWEKKTAKQAIAQGRAQDVDDPSPFWPDYLVEIKPKGKGGAKIIWEWHVWDHMVQFVDDEMPNYGYPAEFPGRIDINGDFSKQLLSDAEKKRLQDLGYLSPDSGTAKPEKKEVSPRKRQGQGPGNKPNGRGPGKSKGTDWMHTNAVDYNAELDLIVISVRRMNEIWIIDHSTTTAEARTETGGRYGKGGSLLFRWGNPKVYGRGDQSEQQLFGQHDAQWIPSGHPGAGNLMVFDNGAGRPGGKWSRVLEIDAAPTEDHFFPMSDTGKFLPHEAKWSYTASKPSDFFSSFISGVQRLTNGNTLICEGDKGRVFEVDPDGTIVWEYWNQFGEQSIGAPKGSKAGGPPPRRGGGGPQPKALFRATRIPADFPGLKFPPKAESD